MIDRNNKYFKQVELLIRILPFIAKELPAVNWKLQNIKAMTAKKRNDAVIKLEKALK